MTKHFRSRNRTGLPAGNLGLPIVAVVGRPNVGKSTLFNRLARGRVAIVHDEPGVTRDRHYADTDAFGRPYTLIDTGGFDPEDKDPMRAGIAEHVKLAIQEADAIVFVTDAKLPLTFADKAAIKLLRRAKKPTFFVANKADSPRDDATDLYSEGVEHVYCVSALHGRGMSDLESDLVKSFPEVAEAPEFTEEIPRIAIIGKPNAGKSSLLNRLAGMERMLVDDKPGTTRDAIDLLVEHDGKKYVFVDTAGIRRKGKVTKEDDAVEGMSVFHAIRSIERSSMTVLVVDAKEGVAEQDAKILGLAVDRFRGIVVALNKTDLLSKEQVKKAIDRAKEKLSFAPFAHIVTISAKTGRGVAELIRTLDRTNEEFTKRVSTGELNRFFNEVLETRPPPTMGARAPRLYYITQAETRPPGFVVITNAPDNIHFSYQRFVINRLRTSFGFEGVPIRVHYRPKRRKTLDEMKADGVTKAKSKAKASRDEEE